MKNLRTLVVLSAIVLLSGCASFFTSFEKVAVDNLYIKKHCLTFNHEFEIPGKKYNHETSKIGDIVIKLQDLTTTLATNKKARETFNSAVREMNKEVLVKDETENPTKRVVKKVYVDQECPSYYYSPEFKAKKITSGFNADENVTYVVVELKDMIFQTTKHRKVKEVFNESVNELNSKPFPLNLLPK